MRHCGLPAPLPFQPAACAHKTDLCARYCQPVCVLVCVCVFVCMCVFCLCLCVCAHKTDLWARHCQPASVCAITCHQFSVFLPVFCHSFANLHPMYCQSVSVWLCVSVWLISPSLLVFCNSVWLCSPSCFFVTLLQPLTSELSASAAPKMALLKPSPLRRSPSTWWAFL